MLLLATVDVLYCHTVDAAAFRQLSEARIKRRHLS